MLHGEKSMGLKDIEVELVQSDNSSVKDVGVDSIETSSISD